MNYILIVLYLILLYFSSGLCCWDVLLFFIFYGITVSNIWVYSNWWFIISLYSYEWIVHEYRPVLHAYFQWYSLLPTNDNLIVYNFCLVLVTELNTHNLRIDWQGSINMCTQIYIKSTNINYLFRSQNSGNIFTK